MNKSGPILIIDGDRDDQEMFTETLKSLPYKNDVVCFDDGDAAMDYLDASDVMPFLIFSDVKLIKASGYEFKIRIRQHHAQRVNCVPYLFFTTVAFDKAVCDAYSGSAQGFFIKPHSIIELETILKNIVAYWQSCVEPRYTAR